jgi:hypothetical protein
MQNEFIIMLLIASLIWLICCKNLAFSYCRNPTRCQNKIHHKHIIKCVLPSISMKGVPISKKINLTLLIYKEYITNIREQSNKQAI